MQWATIPHTAQVKIMNYHWRFICSLCSLSDRPDGTADVSWDPTTEFSDGEEE